MPDDKMDQMPAQGAENQTPGVDDAAVGAEQDAAHADPESGMTADDQEDPCPECKHCPCTCHDHEGDDEVDGEIADHFDGDEEPDDEAGDVIDDVDAAVSKQAPNARMEGLDTTVTKITYKQNAVDQDVSPIDSGADAPEGKVAVPADIKSELAAAIADFDKQAKANNEVDDAKATFAMTVHSALSQLKADLDLGTSLGMKQAQIHMTSWMSPITQHVPLNVKKFVQQGGRKSSLKDLFDTKKTEKKVIAESEENLRAEQLLAQRLAAVKRA
jgi:hypothetical protein